jgi:hypothetical protein
MHERDLGGLRAAGSLSALAPYQPVGPLVLLAAVPRLLELPHLGAGVLLRVDRVLAYRLHPLAGFPVRAGRAPGILVAALGAHYVVPEPLGMVSIRRRCSWTLRELNVRLKSC